MLSLKEAVEQAKRALPDLFTYRPETLRLEAAEVSRDGTLWLVTLSFLDVSNESAAVADWFPTRSYRTFELDISTGELKGLRSGLPKAA